MPMVMPPAEQLPPTRPESWVLAYFTSATLLSGLETPATRRTGDVSLGLELGWLPSLSPAQRRVGFGGVKEEDLNKTPILPRVRVSVGLPAGFSVIVAGTPPIPMFGVTATLLAVGVERPVVEKPRWTVGLRGFGQLGSVRSDFTCPARVVAYAPGSPDNDYGCQAPSADRAALRYLGGEVSVAYRSEGRSRFSPHAAIGVSYMDTGFQVDAVTFDHIDHTHYLSHATVVSASGGVSYRVTPRFGLGVDVFYTPLTVRREVDAPLQTDGFFNVRMLVSYRIR